MDDDSKINSGKQNVENVSGSSQNFEKRVDILFPIVNSDSDSSENEIVLSAPVDEKINNNRSVKCHAEDAENLNGEKGASWPSKDFHKRVNPLFDTDSDSDSIEIENDIVFNAPVADKINT